MPPAITPALVGALLLSTALLNGMLVSSGASTASVATAARAEPVAAARAAPGDLGRRRADPTGTPAPPGPDRPRAAVVRLTWPLSGTPQLVRPFEAPSHEYGPGHRGADLAGDREQPVLSAGDGIVVHAGRLTDRELVSVEHPGGLRTTYEPVSPTVAADQHVTTGQPLGTLQAGHPGCRAARVRTCLHWGARQEDHYLDPTGLVGGRLRLLPWDGAARTRSPDSRGNSS